MIASPSAEDEVIWGHYVDTLVRLSEASRAVLAPGVDRVALVRAALPRSGKDKNAVAWLLPYLKPDELKALFPTLIEWCSVGHGLVHHFRDAVKSLPREWVLARIEEVAEPVLAAGDDEEYRRLLELYRELDRGLTERLARRAAGHGDPDISEAGRDFLELLDEPMPTDDPTPRPPDEPSGQQSAPHQPPRRILG